MRVNPHLSQNFVGSAHRLPQIKGLSHEGGLVPVLLSKAIILSGIAFYLAAVYY